MISLENEGSEILESSGDNLVEKDRSPVIEEESMPTEGGMKLVLQTVNEVLGKSTSASRVVFPESSHVAHNVFENDMDHKYRVTEPTLVSDVLVDFEKDWREPEPLALHLFNVMRRNS